MSAQAKPFARWQETSGTASMRGNSHARSFASNVRSVSAELRHSFATGKGAGPSADLLLARLIADHHPAP